MKKKVLSLSNNLNTIAFLRFRHPIALVINHEKTRRNTKLLITKSLKCKKHHVTNAKDGLLDIYCCAVKWSQCQTKRSTEMVIDG